MAIFHMSAKTIGRSGGSSAVASSAYRAGEKLKDERQDQEHDYTKKQGVVHKEIILPEEAPERFKDRSVLWNEVEQIEKRKDAQLAREIEVALPKELNREEQIEVLKEYANEFVKEGMIADVAMHDKNNGNPHAHIMLTMREVAKDGFGKKNREWNDKEKIEKWRSAWEEKANQALERAGHQERITHKSYEKQGIEKIPTIHLGVTAHNMEKKGIVTDRGNINREIKQNNIWLERLKTEALEVAKQVKDFGFSFARYVKQSLEKSAETKEQKQEETKKKDSIFKDLVQEKTLTARRNARQQENERLQEKIRKELEQRRVIEKARKTDEMIRTLQPELKDEQVKDLRTQVLADERAYKSLKKAYDKHERENNRGLSL